MGPDIEAAMIALLAQRAPGRTICPSEAPRRVDPVDWGRLMPQVHATAFALARAGRVEITCGGVKVDADSCKGVYRLRRARGRLGRESTDD